MFLWLGLSLGSSGNVYVKRVVGSFNVTNLRIKIDLYDWIQLS